MKWRKVINKKNTPFVMVLSTIAIVFFVFIIKVLDATINNIPQTNSDIASVSPLNQATNAGVFSPISVVFTRGLNSEEQSTATITTSPKNTGSLQKSADQKTLSLYLSSPLSPNQTYTATVQYGTKSYSWVFSTVSWDKVSVADQQRMQTQADRKFAAQWQTILQTYPWHNKYLKTKDFFVYFDVSNKQFVAKLYPKTSASTSVDNQVTFFKKIVTAWIKGLGDTAAAYPVNWVIKTLQ